MASSSVASKRKITMACSACFQRNYRTPKSLLISGERLTLNKYCKHCNKVTVHQETK